MNELIFLVEDADGGGYTARALGESIITEAGSLLDLRVQIEDAVQCHFEEIPELRIALFQGGKSLA